jgi:hypothetical protein
MYLAKKIAIMIIIYFNAKEKKFSWYLYITKTFAIIFILNDKEK